MSFLVGDKCRPKYFGARKMSLRLGEKRQIKFYWQQSDSDYFSTCLSEGFFYVYDMEQLDWVKVGENQATAALYPSAEKLYSSKSYLNI